MIDSSTGTFLSFTTEDSEDPKCWSATGEAIRLDLAAALESAGAEIEREMHPSETDWVFYGVFDDKKFTVVLVMSGLPPCNWYIAMEGATPTEKADHGVRAWAQPILESAIRTRAGVTNIRWHDTHLTLPWPQY